MTLGFLTLALMETKLTAFQNSSKVQNGRIRERKINNLYTLFDIKVFSVQAQQDGLTTANKCIIHNIFIKKKSGLLCTKDGDLCGSDLLPEIQDPELV